MRVGSLVLVYTVGRDRSKCFLRKQKKMMWYAEPTREGWFTGMVKVRRSLILAIAVATIVVAELRAVGCPAVRAVVDGAVGGMFRELSSTELAQHEELFRAFLLDEADLEVRALALGYRILRTVPGVLALVEHEDHRTGRGVFLSRPTALSNLVVQAPHRFFDRDTDVIARLLFEEGGYRAAAWNTVPRWSAGGGIRGAADTQATTSSAFVAFARALHRAEPMTTIVQIHGFSPDKRSTPEGRRAGVIVSQGTTAPAPWFRLLTAALTIRFPGAVACFPRRVEELGALSNTTAATLRELGSDRFVHLELSPRWRDRLIHDHRQRARVSSALHIYADPRYGDPDRAKMAGRSR